MTYSNRTNHQSSVGKPKPFIHKAQSLPPDFGQQTNSGMVSIASSPQLRLNAHEIMEVELFVEQVSSNPLCLLGLVDYKELIESMKEESELIGKKVQQLKVEREKVNREEKERRKKEQEEIKRMRKEENETEHQIKRYLNMIEGEKEQKKGKKGKKMAMRKQLSEKIERISDESKIQLQRINREINSCRLNSQNIIQQIVLVQSKIGKVKQQIALCDRKKNKISQIQRRLTIKRTELVIVKTQEIEAIKNYNKLKIQQKTEQSLLKSNKEKKLTKITEELQRAVQKLDRSYLNSMILKSGQNRASLATAADQNQEAQDEQSELSRIQRENPALTEFFVFNLKTLAIENKKMEKKEQDSQYELKHQKVVQQIKRIENEESELDGFTKMLKNKLETINQQINQIKKTNIFK